MKLKIQYILLMSAILISCGRTHKIPKEDFKLIPYLGDEILIFESNKGDIDTIFLEGTGKNISPTDPLDIFPTKLEHYCILNKHSDPSPLGGKHRYLDGQILVEISASETKDTYLKIDFTAKDAWFYGDAWLSKSELERMPTFALKIKGKDYQDIKIFEDSKKEYYERRNHVNKLYWSMSDGIVRYDKKEDEVWELKEKYAPQQGVKMH